MKAKRRIFSILSALVILASFPLVSTAATPQPGLSDTEVTCTVDSRFEFTLPPDATVTYPNTTVLVGQFTINNIFIESNERLAIELVPGVMRARGTGTVLPYTVTFNPPATVDAANIGDAYDVVVTVDAAAFAATRRPFHDADLVFRVRSLLTGDIVWQGTTTVTARKTPPNQGGGGGGVDDDDGDDGGGVVAPPDTGDDTLPEEPVPQASPGIEQPEGGQPGVVIPAEEIPEARPAWSGWWWWWIPVTALVVLLLILLLLLWRRRRREEEQSG